MKLTGLAIYLGIGALLHILFVGATFDRNSAWTYVWLLAWPVALMIYIGMTVLVIAAVLVVAALSIQGWKATFR